MPARLTAAQYARLQGRPRAPRKPRAKAPRLQSEAQLLRQVLGWLKARKVFAWRANAGAGARPDGRGGWRPIKGNPEGTPDVLAVIPWGVGDGLPEYRGMLVAIELKAEGGRLRPAQRAWMESARKAGVLCLTITSLDGLIEAFAQEGIT